MEPRAFVQSGVSQYYSQTHLCVASSFVVFFEGLNQFVATNQGTKSGGPPGDIVFAYLMCKVFRKVKSNLYVESPFGPTVISTNNSTALFGQALGSEVDLCSINYVDENVFPFIGPSVDNCGSQVTAVAPIGLSTFGSYLFRCALALSNSAILFGFRGRKARSVLFQSRFIQCLPVGCFVEVYAPGYGPCQTPIIKYYKHVGVHTCSSIFNNVDVFAHLDNAQVAYAKMAHRVQGAATSLPTHGKKTPSSRWLNCWPRRSFGTTCPSGLIGPWTFFMTKITVVCISGTIIISMFA